MELLALWRGILELEQLGVPGSLVEGDSKVVVGWALGPNCPWLFLDKIESIRHIVASLVLKVAWAPRPVNLVADVLARLGLICRS